MRLRTRVLRLYRASRRCDDITGELHAEVPAVAPRDPALHLGPVRAEVEQDVIGKLLRHARRFGAIQLQSRPTMR